MKGKIMMAVAAVIVSCTIGASAQAQQRVSGKIARGPVVKNKPIDKSAGVRDVKAQENALKTGKEVKKTKVKQVK